MDHKECWSAQKDTKHGGQAIAIYCEEETFFDFKKKTKIPNKNYKVVGVFKHGKMLRFYTAGGEYMDCVHFFVFVYKFGTFDHLKI